MWSKLTPILVQKLWTDILVPTKKKQNGCYQTRFLASEYTKMLLQLKFCSGLYSGLHPDRLAGLSSHFWQRGKKRIKGGERRKGKPQKGWAGSAIAELTVVASQDHWLATRVLHHYHVYHYNSTTEKVQLLME